MKKVLVMALVFALTFVLGYASLVPAQDYLKKLPPGPHYTLNIIGVEKDKTAAMTNSDRHTIFVGLGSPSPKNSEAPPVLVTTRIYLRPGDDFRVCDGNGFDPAYGCDGNPIKQYSGATFQLPCNTALSYTEDFGCPANFAQRSYRVYVRALGKPGGSAKMWTCATDVDTQQEFCTMVDNVIELERSKGQSRWKDVTDVLTSIAADINGDTVIETIALFASGFEDFLWQYDNYGLKHAQIRLYSLSQ